MSIQRRGLIIFREEVVHHKEICNRLCALLLEHVDAERHGTRLDPHPARAHANKKTFTDTSESLYRVPGAVVEWSWGFELCSR